MSEITPSVIDLARVREANELGKELQSLVRLQVAVEEMLADGISPETIKQMVDEVAQQSGRITKG